MSVENRGQCSFCGDLNSYASMSCHRCNTRLPWADALEASRAAQTATPSQSLAAQTWATPAGPNSILAPTQIHSGHIVQPASAHGVQPSPAHRFCTHCASPYAVGAAFCSQCGSPVGAVQHGAYLGGAPGAPLSPAKGSRTSLLERLMGRPKVPSAPLTASPLSVAGQGAPMGHMNYAGGLGQPVVNVSVNTAQNVDQAVKQRSHGGGWFAALVLFLFKVSLVLAFLGGVIAAIKG